MSMPGSSSSDSGLGGQPGPGVTLGDTGPTNPEGLGKIRGEGGSNPDPYPSTPNKPGEEVRGESGKSDNSQSRPPGTGYPEPEGSTDHDPTRPTQVEQ